MTNVPSDSRAAARKRLEERRGFIPHFIVYLVVNTGFVLVWTMTGPDGFFWPIIPILFWGVGIVLHAWNAFFSRPITDADVNEELERMRGESG
ncbi:MAG TPA: 2TM domain-containing protein [Actinophytocola sp.]|jgi:hypothetical protein|uniref:2TM domain-containing protein n=1 Tax=Actinophytocola sp. TaxID=1872138 RepID=UPI002F932862